MLASPIEVSTAHFTMADDIMEMSSEHGHNAGEEDIDIDIDLTEDYFLEDAAPNPEFGTEFHPESSRGGGNDDLMVDEDIDTYAMDDADLNLFNYNGDEALQPEIESPPFAPGEHYRINRNPADTVTIAADALDTSEGHLDEQRGSRGAPEQSVENDVDLGYSEEVLEDDDTQLPVEVITHDDQAPTKEHHGDNTASTNPSNRSPHIESLESIEATSLNQDAISPGHTSDHSGAGQNSNSTPLEGSNTRGKKSALDTDEVPHAHEVIVVYKSVEYALFSTSELDDPDSYFLSDVSIMERPLTEFFKSIRAVIQEELKDEDELCISVEDLGLETEEVSPSKVHRTLSKLTPI